MAQTRKLPQDFEDDTEAEADDQYGHPLMDTEQASCPFDITTSMRSSSQTPSIGMSSQLSLPMPVITQNPDRLRGKKRRQATIDEE